ncbi:hypothetical protein SHIRM173S_01509 [Streptomyces hirsutus]
MPPLVEITVAVALLGFTAMMLGLLVSALVRKEEVTMPLLVLLAIVQVVFCGALLKLDGVPIPGAVAWLVPSRWAFGAMAGTVDLARIARGRAPRTRSSSTPGSVAAVRGDAAGPFGAVRFAECRGCCAATNPP